MNKRVVVSMAVGLLAMALVYLGVENSVNTLLIDSQYRLKRQFLS